VRRPVVLAVDDEPDIGALLAQALGDEFDVVVSTDVEDGLNAARAQRPVLIVLDLRMAGLGRDGFDFVDLYQEQAGDSAAPIVICSALPENAQSVLTGRVAAFLPKPFEVAALTSLVRALTVGP
jgi:two-component system OmpR family response regulator